MSRIQFIEIQPSELADLINRGVEENIKTLIQELSERKEAGSEFLTRKETARFFGTSLVTLHDWSKKGLITPYKMGNRIYFKRSELVESLLRSNTSKEQ